MKFFFLELEAPSEVCWFGLGFESNSFRSFFFYFPFACTLEESVTRRAWYLEVLMTPIRISLSCFLIKDSKKESNEGIFQSGKPSRLEWNIETNIEYSGPSLFRMESTFCSSFLSILHCLHWSARDLNLVNNCSTVSKLLGCKSTSSFSRMCSWSSSYFPNKSSRFSQDSLGVLKPSRWKRRSLDIWVHR